MQILIVTPGVRGTPLGNQVTAQRWSRMLRKLEHRVTVTAKFQLAEHANTDCLVALHAFRSAKSVSQFASCFPGRPIVVGLTGTDLSRDLKSSNAAVYRKAHQSLRKADRIVLLQPNAHQQLPRPIRDKCRFIFQSAATLRPRPKPLVRCFEVVVAGHLRAEKDPMLAAKAARALPASSRIKVCHLGFALTQPFARQARLESEANPRYQWIGGVPHWQSRRRIARSRLLLLTSKSEGGPSVLSEAIMNNVPILSTRISATSGILEPDYPGLFPVGDQRRLAELLDRCETDKGFYRELVGKIRELKKRFAPATELNAWKRLMSELA